MKFAQPTENDLDAIVALLSSHELPTQGVQHLLPYFLVARAADENVIAVAGFEKHAKSGLLRSVAVAEEHRGTGLGVEIVGAVIDKAKSEGLDELVLLTTTAKDFFASKFGFQVSSREEFENTFDESWEWNLPRCSTAVVMRRDLKLK
jgi:N-acetylglutamate synthase-like GNAT family acetyltransferase